MVAEVAAASAAVVVFAVVVFAAAVSVVVASVEVALVVAEALVAASDSTAAITPTAVAIIAIPGLARTTKFVLNCRFCRLSQKKWAAAQGGALGSLAAAVSLPPWSALRPALANLKRLSSSDLAN